MRALASNEPGEGVTAPCARRVPLTRPRFARAPPQGQRECISCYRLDRTAGEHDDFGAGRRALVEVDHIFVAHTDAAGGHVMTDTLGLIGTVNAIERVDLALPKIERAGAQRIIGPAMMP